MKTIYAKTEIINPYLDKISISDYLECQIRHIEKVGRTCYKSEDRITNDSYKKFIKMIINNGHEAMLEHGSFSVRFTVDRGISHELVRHRIASFAQESTRYVCYGEDKRGGELTFIIPQHFSEKENVYAFTDWKNACENAEKSYQMLLNDGEKAQIARNVLPTSVKTEVVMTANFREWRNFFKLRCDSAAHPQMREVTIPLLERLKELCPVMFDDIVC